MCVGGYESFCEYVYPPITHVVVAVSCSDSVVVLEEGSAVTTAHTPTDWPESEEFEPSTSDPIFMSADKFTKTPPPGTLSRVGSWCSLFFNSAHKTAHASYADLNLRRIIKVPCLLQRGKQCRLININMAFCGCTVSTSCEKMKLVYHSIYTPCCFIIS